MSLTQIWKDLHELNAAGLTTLSDQIKKEFPDKKKLTSQQIYQLTVYKIFYESIEKSLNLNVSVVLNRLSVSEQTNKQVHRTKLLIMKLLAYNVSLNSKIYLECSMYPLEIYGLIQDLNLFQDHLNEYLRIATSNLRNEELLLAIKDKNPLTIKFIEFIRKNENCLPLLFQYLTSLKPRELNLLSKSYSKEEWQQVYEFFSTDIEKKIEVEKIETIEGLPEKYLDLLFWQMELKILNPILIYNLAELSLQEIQIEKDKIKEIYFVKILQKIKVLSNEQILDYFFDGESFAFDKKISYFDPLFLVEEKLLFLHLYENLDGFTLITIRLHYKKNPHPSAEKLAIVFKNLLTQSLENEKNIIRKTFILNLSESYSYDLWYDNCFIKDDFFDLMNKNISFIEDFFTKTDDFGYNPIFLLSQSKFLEKLDIYPEVKTNIIMHLSQAVDNLGMHAKQKLHAKCMNLLNTKTYTTDEERIINRKLAFATATLQYNMLVRKKKKR